MTMFTSPTEPAEADSAPESLQKRPQAWSLSNWPVRWKVLAIVLVPLILATIFGALRVHGAMANSGGLRLAAARADLLPALTKYMSALDVALLSNSTGRDVEGAKQNYESRKGELQSRLADTDVIPDVRSGVETLLSGGQFLVAKVTDDTIGLRERVTTYAPLLLTAEDVINASVRVDDEKIRAQAQGLSRAVGARGQMTMQEILITRGAELPEPQLRTSMITLAGTEPSTLFGMSEVLGAGSPEAKTLQQQMVTRMAIMSDPASVLVDNPDLLRSIRTTDGIAEQVINGATESVTKSVHAQATERRDAAITDAVAVLAAIVIALVIVSLVARALVVPLRVLRDGALKVAHTDLEEEVARVKAGEAEPIPAPLPVYTTEEIGQVAHAVDELHSQALLLAGDEARLRLLVNDMFETMSRRSRSLVDQQLSLIDGLERNEEDPERLDSLFRLDHLAARLRRNSANLLVLAGAQLARDQREPVPSVDRHQRCGLRGRGLPPRRNQRSARVPAGRRGGRRRHPPARRADRQRPALLAAERQSSGSRGPAAAISRRSCATDRRLRPGHERRRSAHRQQAAAGRRRRQPRQRPPHGSFRGRPDRRPAPHPGRAARSGAG